MRVSRQNYFFGSYLLPTAAHQNQILTANYKIAHSKFKGVPFCRGYFSSVEGTLSRAYFTKGKPNYQNYLDVYNVKRISIQFRIEYPCLRRGLSRNVERLTFFYMNVLISCSFAFLSRALRYSLHLQNMLLSMMGHFSASKHFSVSHNERVSEVLQGLLVWFWRSPRMMKRILQRFTAFVRYYRRFQINGIIHVSLLLT